MLVVFTVVMALGANQALSLLSTRSQAEQQLAIVQRLVAENRRLTAQQQALREPGDDRARRSGARNGPARRASVRDHRPARPLSRGPHGSLVSLESVIGLWRDGQRRLRTADPSLQPALERVVTALVEELRRRLGGPFTADELAELYLQQGTDWCFDIAARTAPGTPEAWDLTTVSGAAFLRYLRSASDFGGGRVRADEA